MRNTQSFGSRNAFPEVNSLKSVIIIIFFFFEYSFPLRFSIAIINVSQIH